jgi:hypothetical protein
VPSLVIAWELPLKGKCLPAWEMGQRAFRCVRFLQGSHAFLVGLLRKAKKGVSPPSRLASAAMQC